LDFSYSVRPNFCVRMPKEHNFLHKTAIIADSVAKITVYLVLFFVPLIALPFTSDALDFNKQALLIGLVSFGLVAWIVRTVASGIFSLRKSYLNLLVFLFGIVCLISTIFSVMGYGSFWGYPLTTASSFLSCAGFITFFFLVNSLFSEKELSFSWIILGFSVLCVHAYAILQMVGIHIIPFGIGLSGSFNTIGSVGSLGLFAAFVLPLFMILGINSKGWQRILFLANVLSAFVIFLLINYPVVWWACFAACAAVLLFWVAKRHVFDGRWLFIPMFLLIVSLLFAIFNFYLPWKINTIEISLSQKASFTMGKKALLHTPILGTGPGTFSYDFAKYKDPSIAQTQLWNITFPAAASEVMTKFAELGGVGIVIFILLLLAPLFYGIRYLLRTQEQEPVVMNMAALSLPSLVTGIVIFFMYPASFVLQCMWFFLLAVLSAVLFHKRAKFELKSSSLTTMVFTLIFALVFIFDAGIVILDAQRYIAEVFYEQALRATKIDTALVYLKKAASNNPNVDMYFNKIALLSMSKLSDSSVDKTQIQGIVSDAINAANVSVAVGPRNPDNWSTKAYVCQNFIGISEDASTCALDSYDKSLEFDPFNPYLFLQEGNVYLAQAQLQSAQNPSQLITQAITKFQKATDLKKDYPAAYFQIAMAHKINGNTTQEHAMLLMAEKYAGGDPSALLQIGIVYYQENNWIEAQSEFQKALSLNPDYADALFYAGLTYDRQGQKVKAMEMFSRVAQSNPNNEIVKKIVENLRAGKAALDGLAQKPPVTVTPSGQSATLLPPSEQKQVAK